MSDTATQKKKSLREKVSDWGRGPWSLPVSVAVGFVENTAVVVPMEPLFLPLMAMRRRTAWLVAAALLLGNVLGGLLMYWLGAFFAEHAIQPLVTMLDAQDAYQQTLRKMQEDGFMTLFMVGITPFPFQVGTAAAGAAGYSIPLFIVAVTVSRSFRYFAEAGLVMLVGDRAEELMKKHELELTAVGLILFAAFCVYFFLF
ncbi:YqaA family protein [Henriciella aquimarina]|uniref:YqaA family protein n=1 Tax=Henriciella aquimarina TaxID=545261 RepID=UPI000A01781A|nr:VTT domain-containing protein [Henriciella aquimarina]